MPSDEWCDWFAGFVEGEGCFYIHTQGSPRFTIKLREDDKRILEEICSALQVGSVSFVSRQRDRDRGRKSKDQFYFRVSGPNCLKVVEVLEGRMHSKKTNDFELWAQAVRASVALGPNRHPDRKAMMLKYKAKIDATRKSFYADGQLFESENKNAITDNWLSGFSDAEACFMVDHAGCPKIVISLRGDDQHILTQIQSKLGVGSVSFESKQYMRNKGVATKDAYTLSLWGPNCLKVVNALEGKMRSKKVNDFEIWARAVRATVALNSRRHPDRKPMMLKYKAELEACRKSFYANERKELV